MLNIDSQLARMGKIHNDIEHHGEDEKKAFDIPLTLALDSEQLRAMTGAKFLDRILFNHRGEVIEPNEDFLLFKGRALRVAYVEASVTLELSGGMKYSYEGVSIDDIEVEPKFGGLTETKLWIRVRPSNQKEIFLLLDHQHRDVRLSIADAKLAEKKRANQQDLPLDNGEDKAAQLHVVRNDDAPASH